MDSSPDTAHTTSPTPTEPLYSNTPLGDTKIPEPMIIPTIIPTPSINPSSFFSLTPPDCEELSLVSSPFSLAKAWISPWLAVIASAGVARLVVVVKSSCALAIGMLTTTILHY
ncbi:hypothetical protein E2C01_067681 [Portunus trituberculatus]|uniref:Uncharacterized protein n=1 Tax=Portunus trituberculatus TaxID=210409 RepID=A0A5B7HY28_PORTR|nr:hypothetical protein [Portunus trituberculatus]